MLNVAAATLFGACLAAAAQAQENPYLEIPLEGRYGDEITARGLEEALQAALCPGVKHIVFIIDSQGGDQNAARDIYNLLARYDKVFTFHAIVREASGVAVAPLVWCESILVRPGAKIGGVNITVDQDRYPGVEPGVVLANLAMNAAEEAKRHGHSAELIGAMIDPGRPLNAWRDSAGRVQISRWVPNGVHTDDFIVWHVAGSPLALTERQAVELRFARAYDGDAAGLGRELGFPGWSSAGDAGRAAMADATMAEKAKAVATTSDRQRFLVDQNLRRRTATKSSIERFMKLAQTWDPKLGTYTTIRESQYWWSPWWDGCRHDSGRLTAASRRTWMDRTDLAVAALSRARGSVLEMKQLEKEALGFGQKPLYPEGKLEEMRRDLELKSATLVGDRERRFKEYR
jgi:hypothetical protein